MPKQIETKYIEWLVHLLGWFCIFTAPLLFHRHETGFNWNTYGHGLFVPTVMLVGFYVNYLFLVPRYFMRHRYGMFLVLNAALMVVMCICINRYMHLWIPQHSPRPMAYRPHHTPIRQHGHLHPPMPFFGLKLSFVMRDVFTLVATIATAIALRLSIEWHTNELNRQRSQLEQTGAALQNLKSQTSPHFLLNTLNNIYSLIAFDTDKAQQAVMDLAKMLRYQLYESDAEMVPLTKEAAFLDNYITLMRMRLGENVRIDYHLDITANTNAQIAPHILICLVENAFKHGICAKSPSFIDISLRAHKDAIHFVCSNSNHPKRSDDKTPGGIGLQQVQQRLSLLYPDRHTWHHGPSADGTIYTSEITLTLNP